jgi:predicted fused transcriptional regulator/phosphomethylpyrimidine kinase
MALSWISQDAVRSAQSSSNTVVSQGTVGSNPAHSATVMSRDIVDRRTYAGYVTAAFGARG